MAAYATFDSGEVSGLVGIGPLLLNKFVERGSYGIRPSVRSGKGRGGRRLFSIDDLYGVALVWWLFESGLRSGVIENILKQICASAKGIASEAAKRLIARKTDFLRVRTEPRRMHPGLKVPRQSVRLVPPEKPSGKPLGIELEIPVGPFYGSLLEKMFTVSELRRGE